MITFDLICREGEHRFEGWFGSTADYDQQQARGLIECPVCGDHDIRKAVMAPNIGAKSNQIAARQPAQKPSADSAAPQPASASGAVAGSASPAAIAAAQVPAEYQQLLKKIAKAQQQLLAKSEWVGADFADRARDIYYGDAKERPIHGTASVEEAQELAEEGINVAALPLPIIPSESQN